MSTLYVESVALQTAVRERIQPLLRRDQDLAKRLKRAADDLPDRIAEGMSTTGRARRKEYSAALSSAREALACVKAAESVGYLHDENDELSQRIERLLERILTTLS